MKKLLITGAWRYSHEQYEALVDMGYDISVMPDERAELPKYAEEAEVIICNGLFLYHDVEKFSKLRVVQLTSAGLDRIPMDRMTERGIAVYNARGVYSTPMAEYAMCGVLSLYKQSRFFYENQKAHKWQKNRDMLEICGKTVLIVGAGNVGTECAKRFSAFDAKVYGVDLYPRNDETYEDIFPLESLKEQIPQADVIVLTLPLTDNTKHLFDKDMFNKIKEGAVIVNIARGAVVETEALIEALQTNKLGGAVLDVFEDEPLSEDSPLWDMENVIITPHNSFVGDGNGERLFNIIKYNLKG